MNIIYNIQFIIIQSPEGQGLPFFFASAGACVYFLRDFWLSQENRGESASLPRLCTFLVRYLVKIAQLTALARKAIPESVHCKKGVQHHMWCLMQAALVNVTPSGVGVSAQAVGGHALALACFNA